ELTFAGVLGGRRVRMVVGKSRLPIAADADFCITGYLDPDRVLPEGPFGDHLGYYSLAHPFPVMRVEKVYHRRDAIWPFTVVGRPPQEDTVFGEFIHTLTELAIPRTLPGVDAVHAVDAAGVHPLLLAIGHERYVPYEPRQPRELLTQANAILGQGQLSLAKYLWIAASEDFEEKRGHSTFSRKPVDASHPARAQKVECPLFSPVYQIEAFFRHMLRRVDWRRDLHFQTATTIDTLDYSGTAINEGSKLVIAAAGPPIRELSGSFPGTFHLPEGLGFSSPQVGMEGILVLQGPSYASHPEAVCQFTEQLDIAASPEGYPLIVIADDSSFTARNLENLLWVTFTRSNPATDVYGVGSFTESKHWGCRGPLVIDARIKPHHAPPLVEDPEVTARVNHLAAPGGPLHGLLGV
ncbi:MAG: UbiD family decarboxylase, partial [Planctomycetia bacterium]